MPKKFKRKTEKRYPMVRFTLPEIYGDAEFVLPDQSSFDLGTQRALVRNEIEPMFGTLRAVGVDEETIQAMDELQGDEVMELMKAWQKASPVDSGKSSD